MKSAHSCCHDCIIEILETCLKSCIPGTLSQVVSMDNPSSVFTVVDFAPGEDERMPTGC